MTSPRKRLASTIKASKSTLKILVDEDAFFNLALFFASRNSKLLKRYAKKLKTIKANSIVRSTSFSKNESIRKKIVSRLTNVLITNRQATRFATIARQMLSKMTNSSNETTTRFQAIQDSCNAILDIDLIVVINIYALLKNIAKFANKST